MRARSDDPRGGRRMSVFNEALEWQDHAEQIDMGRNVMAANSGAAAADDRLDLNTGKGWSEMDLFDLAITVRMKNSIEFIAIFPGPVTSRSARQNRGAEAIRRTRTADR